MRKILIADGEFSERMDLSRRLTTLGYEIAGETETGRRAVDMARNTKPDLIIIDIMMPGEMDGVSAAEIIKRESDIAIVFTSGSGDPKYFERAKKVEPFGYLIKPFKNNNLPGTFPR